MCMNYELCRAPLQYEYVLHFKVTFILGLFSYAKHKHSHIFTLASPRVKVHTKFYRLNVSLI